MSQELHRFWGVPELVELVFGAIPYRRDASHLARSHKAARKSSFRRIWSEPLYIPTHFPKPGLDGTVPEHVQGEFRDHSVYVKTVNLDLLALQHSPKWTNDWFPPFPFPNLQHLVVRCDRQATHLHRFLPPSLLSFNFQINCYPDEVLEVDNIVPCAPALANLTHLSVVNVSGSRRMFSPNIKPLFRFLQALPNPDRVVQFSHTDDLAISNAILDFVASLSNLRDLDLDLRFPWPYWGPNGITPPPPEPPLSALAAPGLTRLRLHAYRQENFNVDDIRHFPNLTHLTLLIEGFLPPLNLAALCELIYLQHVDLQFHDPDLLLNATLFDRFVDAWPNVEHLSIMDSRCYDYTFQPLVAVPIQSLRRLSKRCGHIENVRLAVSVPEDEPIRPLTRKHRRVQKLEVHYLHERDDERVKAFCDDFYFLVCEVVDYGPYGRLVRSSGYWDRL